MHSILPSGCHFVPLGDMSVRRPVRQLGYRICRVLTHVEPVDGQLRLALEAQQVIAARFMRLARADTAAALEANRMVQEKLAAFFEAQAAAGIALARGAFVEP